MDQIWDMKRAAACLLEAISMPELDGDPDQDLVEVEALLIEAANRVASATGAR